VDADGERTGGTVGATWLSRCTAVLAAILFSAVNAAAGALWVPNRSDIVDFQGVLVSGPTAPHRRITSLDIAVASGIAFDQGGNLWSTNFFVPSSLIEFTHAQLQELKKHPAPPANVIITDSGAGDLAKPEGLAFDSNQNLWVGAELSREVLEYTRAQLATSGNPVPNIILNGNSFSFSSPSDVLFDKLGNLWVIDEDFSNGNGGAGEAFRYDAEQLSGLNAGTNHVDPAFGFGIPAFQHIEGAAFDNEGNMWIADENADTVSEFLASDLAGSGLGQNPTPAVTLSARSMKGRCPQSLDSPYGVALDTKGNLFVVNADGSAPNCFGSLAKFSRSSIAASGSPKPKVFIVSNRAKTNLDFSGYITFGPKVP
jgi:hypothetical protein